MRSAALILLLPATALAQTSSRHASVPQELLFEDTYEVFSLIAFDTGYIPSINDPISVRFHITPTGGVVTSMEAESALEWLPAFEHQVIGVPGTGTLAIDAEIEVEAEVHIDIFGLWTGSVPLWLEQVSLSKDTAFEPLLLGDSASVSMSGDGLIDPFELGYTVFPGLDVVLEFALYPALEATLTGLRIESESDDGVAIQDADGAWASLPTPFAGHAQLPLDVTWVGDLDSLLSFVIEPSVNLDTFLGNFQLLAFPIDVPLIDQSGERAFPTQHVSHPLPLIGPLPPSLDAGDVALDGLANVPLTIENWGDLPLEGTARIVGSDDFSVFPDSVYIAPGGSDGLMISFAPVIPGDRAVVLELETNDPLSPIVQIALTGTALGPEPEDEGRDGPVDPGEPISGEDIGGGCGCASSTPSGSWAWLLALGLLRRRRA